MPIYKTPGAYIEEIPAFPPSVVPVATAVPAFVGYTQLTSYQGKSLINKPTKVDSLKRYSEIFGTITNEVSEIKLDSSDKITAGLPELTYRMFYSLQLFFANGGRECYVVSVGDDISKIAYNSIEAGLLALEKEDEPTILVFPDALKLVTKKPDGTLNTDNYFQLYQKALQQCQALMDRVVLIDVPVLNQSFDDNIKQFRTGVGTDNLKYGIAYYPDLVTTLSFQYDPAEVKVTKAGSPPPLPVDTKLRKTEAPSDQTSLFHSDRNDLYVKITEAIDAQKVVLPASAAMAGVYARVDRTRGVHVAPANVSVVGGKPSVAVDDDKQRDLNVPPDGKSINAIRSVAGRGDAVVWGARTLDGSSNEWRYVNVRRYYNYVEQSVKQSTFPFVFEPNNKNTWERLKSMIVNFLTNEWAGGALAGEKAEDAFFVNVGFGSTMTALDIQEGRLIVEIGMAVVRPAEFIILRFSHKMQEA